MGSEVILIVEDNDVLRQGLQALLQSEGYAVQTAVHGLEALSIMQNQTPDLIVSDIMMPEMDGYEFFHRVRDRVDWVYIPFIFLTARKEKDDQLTGIRLGAEDYLVKPITKMELLTTIRSRLARSEQLLLAQLGQAYESSLIMLANAIEYRNPHVYGHVERVRDHSLSIAAQAGCTDSHRQQIHYGSILHDIGKIHIHASVLHKAGPLNDAEWAEIKKHPLIGVDLIKNVPYLTPAIPVIRNHHERWDGMGYPDGLAGEDIPISARIVAVADAFDAMTGPGGRPYRRPYTPEEAYQEVMRCSGTHFDPNVVNAFQRAWEQINLTFSTIV